MNWTTYNNAGAALSQSLTDMPVGTITGYAGATAPSGWLLCDGAAVSRTTYAELFGVVSTTYGSGDGSTTFNVPDSSGFIILASSQAARLAAAALPQYVTSLPSSPVDGQTVVYAADATNGVMWTLRYRAASSSSYKWEFVGGTSMATYGATTSRSTTSTTYTALTGEAIEVTVPLAGDYRIEHGFAKGYLNATGYFEQTVKLGTAAASGANGVMIENALNTWTSSSLSLVATGLAASSVLALQHQVNTGTAAFQRRWLTAVPVRVG